MSEIKSWYGPGGALVTDQEIKGVTHVNSDNATEYYGGRYFIAESMKLGAAKRISESLNLSFQGVKNI